MIVYETGSLPPVTDETLFARWPVGWSGKVRCRVCHQSGYPGGRWEQSHRRGHLPCTRGCGVHLSVLRNGKARTHSRCPRG